MTLEGWKEPPGVEQCRPPNRPAHSKWFVCPFAASHDASTGGGISTESNLQAMPVWCSTTSTDRPTTVRSHSSRQKEEHDTNVTLTVG